jgi:cytochrome c biogenesis protein CcmG/thiol:disulfide interchange protein DsbE
MFCFQPEILAMKFIPLILFICVSFFLWRGLSVDPHTLPSPFINKSLPDFALPELIQPEKIFHSRELRGHVTLLNIFASWCISCRVEHPIFMNLVADKKIILYGVDYKDSRNTVLQWLKTEGNPYRKIGFDEKGNVAINLGVYGTPETFLIDKKGVIRDKYIGPVTEEVWENQLKPEVDKLEKQKS